MESTALYLMGKSIGPFFFCLMEIESILVESIDNESTEIFVTEVSTGL